MKRAMNLKPDLPEYVPRFVNRNQVTDHVLILKVDATNVHRLLPNLHLHLHQVRMTLNRGLIACFFCS